MRPLRVVLPLALAAALLSCQGHEEVPPGWLDAARRAHREGKTVVTVPIGSEPNEGPSLRGALTETAVVVATPLPRAPQVTIMAWYLMTWHVLHIDERLVTGPPSSRGWCAQLAGKGPEVGASELALALGGGTKVIEGVTFNYTSRESGVQLVAGQQYVMFLRECPSRRANLVYDVDSVQPVSRNGTITPSRVGRPFVQELKAVGNLNGLRALIASIKKPG